jgi:hypothetical protein
VKLVKGERILNKIRNDVYNDVIDPLVEQGADPPWQVMVLAQVGAAIRENTVELGIMESLTQRGITAVIQTG